MSQNIVAAFFESVKRNGEKCCFHRVHEGGWQKHSWNEVSQYILRLCNFLKTTGVKRGDRIAVMSQSRMEWSVADLSILTCGAITVPIYPTYPAMRIQHILRDADINLIFVENPSLKNIVEESASSLGKSLKIISFDELFKIINDKSDVSTNSVEEQIRNIRPEEVATIIYTSGTTGQPKGVVLTHGNIMAEVKAALQIFHFPSEEIGLLCLPLSHVLGRLMQYHQLACGYELAFLQSYDKFVDNCRDVRPHLIVGVPRMIEKLHEGLEQMLDKGPLWKRRLFDWSIKVGQERGNLIQGHKPIPTFLSFKYYLAHLLVFKKLINRLGGRLKLFICGGAPLAKSLGKFFQAMDMLILEGYGLTETFAAATVNRPDDYHFGTVGKPIPGLELKLAPDGEILIKGPTVFKSYLNLPQETAQAKSADGWLRTGDIGEISRDGFLRITDRKKDIIVTAGGQNVAPQMIEISIMENRFINHCMVYGDRKKYLVALITLNMDAILDYARQIGVKDSIPKLFSHPQIYELINSIVREKNGALARHETIKKFAILESDFSQESGELTPTLKIRRKFTVDKYREILEALYKE